MSWDKNRSPVGWYVGSYMIRFIELAEEGNDDPERIFTVWENTVLVRATSIDEAFEKIERIGRSETEPYKGGPPPGVDVQWLFEGVTEVLPVYEEIEDGVEIMWAEWRRKLKNIRRRALPAAPKSRP
ncbi:MAG: DUF4288 domain-containing protein [Methylobacteriaceae bacterium]|nr:DUF4288 domain-containing protein [Methylobacteriaceae bacterium]MBV9703353.1 DUF4288 domain-containing protein [Methylobacteriaceae bacterium]